MALVIHKKYSSPNYDNIVISPEFLILHYTASSLSGTLEIFQDPGSKVSSHLVIDRNGAVYELVPCLSGKCLKAWHAGDSQWAEKNPKKTWKNFNNFSIGIELVNKNGNLFPYTKSQYLSLNLVCQQLKSRYPALTHPGRVLGHEHIAHHRGKADPGYCFDWLLFFKQSFRDLSAAEASQIAHKRWATLPDNIRKKFQHLSSQLVKKNKKDKDWQAFNQKIEQAFLNASSHKIN